VVQPIAQPDLIQQLIGAGPRGLASQLERHLHVLPGGERRDELEGLEDKPDLGGPDACPLVLGHDREVRAVEPHPAGRREIEPGEEAEQRSLAAAGRPYDGQEAAILEGKGDILQDREGVSPGKVGLGQFFTSQHRAFLKNPGESSSMIRQYPGAVLLVSLLAACGGGDSPRKPAPPPATPGAPAPATPNSEGARAEEPVMMFLGTSLTAGYGLDPSVAYPEVIQRMVDSAGYRYRVVNAGVSGETSAGALRRTEWLFQQAPPAIFILETGGNDGLRGLEPDSLEANVLALLERASRLDPPPLLVLAGMEAPPNLGRSYTDRFRAVYPSVANRTGATLIPFLLAGVAGVDSLNLPDGIHPTAAGHAQVARTVWAVLEPLLEARREE
jgi:acyl-CoA thioesterase-1